MTEITDLAKEIAMTHNITAEDAQNMLDGINAGKAGNTEANYIAAIEYRDKALAHLSEILTMHGISSHDQTDNLAKLKFREPVYLIILVDHAEEVIELNRTFRSWENDRFKIEAFRPMSQMVGLRHKGLRPTHIIDAIKDRSHPSFEKWYSSEVKRNAVKAYVVGGPLNDSR